MPVNWKLSTDADHNALPRRSSMTKDPGWEAVMGELDKGNAVRIEYHDAKERGAVSRSVGRRAAHRGFKADIRQGDGYISVRKGEDTGLARGRGSS